MSDEQNPGSKFDENCAVADAEEWTEWLSHSFGLEKSELDRQSVAPQNGKANFAETAVVEANEMELPSLPPNVKNAGVGGVQNTGGSNESGSSNQQQIVGHEQAVQKHQMQPNHVSNPPAEHLKHSTSTMIGDQQPSAANSFVAEKYANQLNHNHSNNQPYLAVSSPAGTWSTGGTSTMPMSLQHRNRYFYPNV